MPNLKTFGDLPNFCMIESGLQARPPLHTTKSIRLMPMSQSTVRKGAITTLRVLPLLALLAAVVREAKTSKPLRPAKLCLRWPTTH